MEVISDFIGLMERFRKIEIFDFPNLEIDLTISQLKMIGFVHNNNPCRTQNIADGMVLSAPTVSVAVKKLVALGWLEKNPDPEDGRATLISLADKSLDIIGQMKKKQLLGINRVLSSLNEEEQKSLFSLLNRIVNSFEEMGEKNRS